MGDQMQMDLPANMTEEDVLSIVRELLCGDGMTDEELRVAYNSGMFQELCPDIENYAKQRKMDARVKEQGNIESVQGGGIKLEKVVDESELQLDSSKMRDEKKTDSHLSNAKVSKIKEEADSESESVVSGRHSHHKKKKKKHSKDHKKRDKDRDERKEKSKSHSHETEKDKIKIKAETKPKVINSADSSESENERRRKEEKLKKEKKKRVIQISSSSDSDASVDRNKKRNHEVKMERSDPKDISENDKNKTDDIDVKPKIHPFYQDKSNDAETSQPLASNKDQQEPKREKTPEKKKEPKPFSKYNSYVSNTNLKRWRPILHKEHLRYQRKYRLKPMSVVCVNLLDLPMVFHHPRKHSKNPNAVPLASGVIVSGTRLEMIRRLERDKANWFKKKINRKAMKFLKLNKHKRYDSSDDDDRKPKRARIMDRIVSSSDTSSDSSSIVVPSKKTKKDDDFRDRVAGGKMSKAQREAEAKKRKIEELKRKVDKFTAKGTRVLAWENKDTYFKSSKKKEDPAKEKEKAIAEKKKKLEQIRKEKLEQQKNAPSISFQRILKQIETANKEQAAKPKVELKIPKKTQNFDRPVPISEYKLDGKIGVGDVYNEVSKLLTRNVLVECPNMPEGNDDLGEYTVKKIAWWILKNEKEPAVEGVYHPECHDDEDRESVHEDDFDWPSDVSSINGCVSDPEGIAADIPPDPKKVADPDWADDYCGEASLYAKFRKENKEIKNQQFPIDSLEPFKGFLRTKPGTNYSKPNFEVKCFVCSEILKGQRQYGAHIRSESHKNNFRNYSLDLANYEEHTYQPEPRKIFKAQLVEYSTTTVSRNSTTEKSDLSSDSKQQIGKIERARSDSPGPIVGGDAAPNIMVHQAPIPDDISLPSIEDYDISSDESLMNVRVAIRTAGKWNDDLERRWRTWRDEEAKIAQEYNVEREYYIENPELHPNMQEEWIKFWDRRCLELENEGKDPENYNFHKEWMAVWLKRVQEIMHEKVEERVAQLKKSLLIDKHSLRKRFGISAEATRRKKKKRKVGKREEENSSSLKTSDKVESNGHGPNRQPMGHAANQRNLNDVHSKPACLPTPPVTDENRERGSSNSDDSHSKERVESRYKHEKQHESRNDRHNHRHESRRDRHDKFNRDRKHKSERKRNSSHSSDDSNSRSNKSGFKKGVESVSSISSLEPPPPGEEPISLGSSRKAGRPPPPVISESSSRQMMELNERIENEVKEKLASRNLDHSTNQNAEFISQNSSKPREKSDVSDDTRKETMKSKHATSWSDDSLDKEQGKKRQRRNSGDSSSSSNTKTLQNRLQALREALASEEGRSTKPSERPKVIPLEKSDNKQNLSDGEVASDISDLDINAPKGVSTFVNKEIPGLADLDKSLPSQSNLDKNSLGFHLLERKKSVDDHQSSSHSDRPKHDKRDDKYSKNHHRRDERHGKSHSSRHDDRNNHKGDYRGSRDERRRWDNSKDNRNYKEHRGNRGDVRGDLGYDHRNARDFKHKKNHQPSFNKNNQFNSGGPPRPLMEESWEPEDSRDSNSKTPTSFIPSTYDPPFVPENARTIPVLESTSSRPPTQPFSGNPGHWNGGWGENQGYNPHGPTDYYY